MDKIVAAYHQEFNDRQAKLAANHLPWLASLRQAGMECFVQQGFPSPKLEAWKYTPVTALIKSHLPTAYANSSLSVDNEVINNKINHSAILPLAQSHRLVFIDGAYQPQFTNIGKLPEGVTLGSLSSAYTLPAVAANLSLLAKPKQGFTALNQAFSQDGYYLCVPDGVKLEQPIEIICLNTQPSHTVYLRHLAVVGQGSQASIIENYLSTTEQLYVNNCITECLLHEQASLQHCKLQQEAMTAAHIGTVYVQQHAGSKLQAQNFNFGSQLARTDIEVTLAGEFAECHLNGLYLANNRQHSDQHTQIIHQQANTTSRENYRGILDGAARGVFNGRIEVLSAAQKTDAQLHNKNLLLSKEAEVDTKPELEIYADDVKCSHGATVSQLDEQAIFYLRSRGMDLASARSTLIYAFAAQMLTDIENISLRQGLNKQLLASLPFALASQELL